MTYPKNTIQHLDSAVDNLHDPYAQGLVALAVMELNLYHKRLKGLMKDPNCRALL